MAGSFDVFLSYRRDSGGSLAQLIREKLQRKRLKVFLDVSDLKSGPFGDAIFRRIDSTANFVVILTPNCLNGCWSEDDWMRKEISRAIITKRNLVPLLAPGFNFPNELPQEIEPLRQYNGVPYNHEHTESSIQKLIEHLQLAHVSLTALSVAAAIALLALGLAGFWPSTQRLVKQTQSQNAESAIPPQSVVKSSQSSMIKSTEPSSTFTPEPGRNVIRKTQKLTDDTSSKEIAWPEPCAAEPEGASPPISQSTKLSASSDSQAASSTVFYGYTPFGENRRVKVAAAGSNQTMIDMMYSALGAAEHTADEFRPTDFLTICESVAFDQTPECYSGVLVTLQYSVESASRAAAHPNIQYGLGRGRSCIEGDKSGAEVQAVGRAMTDLKSRLKV